MNAVKLFEDAAQAEASQILPQAIAPGLKVQGIGSFSRFRMAKVLAAILRNNIVF
jgi:hypothetical protein